NCRHRHLDVQRGELLPLVRRIVHRGPRRQRGTDPRPAIAAAEPAHLELRNRNEVVERLVTPAQARLVAADSELAPGKRVETRAESDGRAVLAGESLRESAVVEIGGGAGPWIKEPGRLLLASGKEVRVRVDRRRQVVLTLVALVGVLEAQLGEREGGPRAGPSADDQIVER